MSGSAHERERARESVRLEHGRLGRSEKVRIRPFGSKKISTGDVTADCTLHEHALVQTACVVNVTNRGLTDNHRDSTRGPNAAGHTRSFRTDTDTRELLTK